MKHTLRRLINLSMVLVLLSLGACGYKKFENDSAQLKTTGAELLIEYQRRTAVVTNLLNLLKAQQDFDQPKWTAVMNARDKAMAIDAVPDLLNDAQKLEKYQQAQSDVTSAVTQLLAVSESNAELRANPTFIDVQAQLASGSLCELLPGQVVDVPLYWHHWRNGGELLAALTLQLQRSAGQWLVPG